jgi:NAD-dependent SIR2 family protein deacetylase
MLLVGTSTVVQPAASLPFLAKQSGAQIIEINIERPSQVQIFYYGKSRDGTPQNRCGDKKDLNLIAEREDRAALRGLRVK